MNDESRALIEGSVNRDVTRAMGFRGGSLHPQTMGEAVEVAKMMALGQQAVPKHLRDNPGLCFGVVMQAKAWEMDVFAVARNSFVVNDQLAYMSQLLHAVIEQRAPLKGRLRCTYDGEGAERTCTVAGTFDGESEPHTYTTPKFKDIPIKNSPLWKWDVDQQMFYFASRAWARKWCPDVLLGVYSPDEAQYAGETAREVTDVVVNPLGGDDDQVTQAEIDEANAMVTPTARADAPKAEKAPKQRAPRKNAPAKPAAPAQDKSDEERDADDRADNGQNTDGGKMRSDPPAHPDTVKAPPPAATARWGFEQYLVHVRQWTELAVDAAGNIEGFLGETYIKNRWEEEKKLRNNLGVALTQEEKTEALTLCREAVNAIKAKMEAGNEAPDSEE